MTLGPVWQAAELESDRLTAIASFRRERMLEPLEEYLTAFDESQGVVEDLLEITVDLTELERTALDVLCDRRLALAFRYLAGPMISADDLKTLAECVLTPSRLKKDPEMVGRIVDVIRAGMDRRRFVWMSEGREPTEHERAAAILATASLIAHSRAGTNRRSEGKAAQELAVKERLVAAGLKLVNTREIVTLRQAPHLGEFCKESKLGSRKADLVVTAWNGIVIPIECKVSNSAVNSVKRLNNDAAVKATSWRSDFGTTQVAPVAVLSGVFGLHNLVDAQDRGLTLFWAHNLDALADWILSTRAA